MGLKEQVQAAVAEEMTRAAGASPDRSRADYLVRRADELSARLDRLEAAVSAVTRFMSSLEGKTSLPQDGPDGEKTPAPAVRPRTRRTGES